MICLSPEAWRSRRLQGCRPDIWSNTHQVEDLVLAPQNGQLKIIKFQRFQLKVGKSLKHIEAVNVLLCNRVFDLATPSWPKL
jgi:hypothetical protein